MSSRTLLLALLASAGALAAAAAGAQGFTSVSSLPAAAAPVAAPVPEVAGVALSGPVQAGTDAPAVPSADAIRGSAPTVAATAAAALAFSSISSLDGSGGGPSLPSAAGGLVMADRIVVEKGARRLYLYSRGRVIGEYPIKLGLSPKGHKQYEGDFRTPEGVYYLSRRNARSEYFMSVEISYPNEADRARAEQEGLRPGGMIMIHGQPNVPRRPADYYSRTDWTNGCVAVSNSDMVEIWQRTRIGIPIEIRP